jgi:phosphatidylserine decarboxylase
MRARGRTWKTIAETLGVNERTARRWAEDYLSRPAAFARICKNACRSCDPVLTRQRKDPFSRAFRSSGGRN